MAKTEEEEGEEEEEHQMDDRMAGQALQVADQTEEPVQPEED